MDRRTLIVTGAAALGGSSLLSALARAEPIALPEPLPPAKPTTTARAAPAPAPAPERRTAIEGPPPPATPTPSYPAQSSVQPYERDEIVNDVSDFLGVGAESAGGAVERIFAQYGRPTAYIAGEEGSGAFVVGARYGRGLLYMKGRKPVEVFWQGPSAGWDFGGNASRVFTLCYNLEDPRDIFQRYPGVEGSAYFIGGLGVNYQKADQIVLAPIRAGVGFRLGANVGYLSYSRQRNFLPF
jgi:hypothetical protein